jgi:hypothetical protein
VDASISDVRRYPKRRGRYEAAFVDLEMAPRAPLTVRNARKSDHSALLRFGR